MELLIIIALEFFQNQHQLMNQKMIEKKEDSMVVKLTEIPDN